MTNKNLAKLAAIFVVPALMAACGSAATPRPIAQEPATTNTQSSYAPTAAPAMPRPTDAPKPAAPTAAPYAAPAAESRAYPPAAPGGVMPVRPTPIPPDNQFKDAGINPPVNAGRDHLSTFGLDVDTASYSMAKEYLRKGQLPPYASVRAEEFINAFKQGYPTPRDVAFGIYADGALSPFHTDGSYLVRVGVQGYRVPDSQRKPGAYVFVVDESGSMSMDNRIDLARQSLKMLVGQLREGDTVGIVAFTTTSREVLQPTPAEQRDVINRAIDSIVPKASTNLQSGLMMGYAMANRAFRAGAANRVILLSDGVANEGGIKPDEILTSVQEFARRGIALTSVGVGFGNYNDTLMEKLADQSEGGNYLYINNMADAEKQFAAKVSGLQNIARDAKVQVDFNADAVQTYRLIGYENRAVADQDFRNDSVKGGGLSAGHTATAIYQVTLKPGAAGRIATVNLRWNDPDTNQTKEINGNVNVSDLSRRFDEAAPRFQLAAVVAQFAEVLRQSPYASRASLGDLSERASALAGQLSDDNDVREFAQLATQAARVR
ncbi:MAG TPA: von Willebrand factor type A domain-containing protein [Thermoflexales bacterium]|nr:von Willebrand factor type A domain-containing protein [Thermoflexales bacterium]